MGNKQKLCYCDWAFDLADFRGRPGWRWVSNTKDESDEDEGDYLEGIAL